MKVFVFLLFSVFLFAKNILILNSYSIKFPWTKGELEGILKKLNNREDIRIFIEFMDTKYFQPTPERIKNFYLYLSDKYKNIKFDEVITTDDNALNFVRKYKNSPIFENSKVFFAGVNNLSLASLLKKSEYAGVFEKKEPLVNLEFAKKIVPDLKTVYIVADNSNSAKAVMREYNQSFSEIKNLKLIFINTSHLQKVLDVLKKAPMHSAMLLLTPFSFHINGRHIGYKKAIRLISENFDHPVIIHSDLLASVKDSNIVGGKATDALSQGEIAAQKVLEYLGGTDMKNIGFTFEKANKMYLNVLNLRKFGIDAYSLGYRGAVYVNRPKTFFEKYREWIISLGVALFGILAITVVLFIKNFQLRRYNEKISKTNKELEEKIFGVVKNLREKEKLLLHQTKVSATGEMFLMSSRKIKELLLQISNKNPSLSTEIETILKKLSGVERFFDQSAVSEFDLKEATREVVESLEDVLGRGFVSLRGGSVVIFGYKHRFEQVVLDFLYNLSKIRGIKEVVFEFKDGKILIYIEFFNLTPALKQQVQKVLQNELYYTKLIMEQYFCNGCRYYTGQNRITVEIVL